MALSDCALNTLGCEDEFEEFRARSYSGGFVPSLTEKHLKASFGDKICAAPGRDLPMSLSKDEAVRLWLADQSRAERPATPPTDSSVDTIQCVPCCEDVSKDGARGSFPNKSQSPNGVCTPIRPPPGPMPTISINSQRRPVSPRHKGNPLAWEDFELLEGVEDWNPGDMRPRVLSLPTRPVNHKHRPLIQNSQPRSKSSTMDSIRSYTITNKGLKKDYVRPGVGCECLKGRIQVYAVPGSPRGVGTPSAASTCSLASSHSQDLGGGVHAAKFPSVPSAYRVAVLGRTGVGKTTLVTRFMDNPDVVQSFGEL